MISAGNEALAALFGVAYPTHYNMVIPKTAQNKAGAYKFMNFLLDERNNKQNTEWVGYATPNKAARASLPAEIKHDNRFYPYYI